MFSLISTITKYTVFAAVVLVLSHVIEIQGVSISKYIEKFVKVASGFTPEKQAKILSEEYKASLEARMKDLNKLDAEISPEDQQALKQVIQQSEERKK